MRSFLSPITGHLDGAPLLPMTRCGYEQRRL
nr:MAG TPA: hypothetical protein [Caudoviricetes sp.]